MNRIIDIYDCHKQRYGYRRITLELQNQGVTINHKKVKRLMSIMGLYGITPKAKYKSYKRNMDGVVSNHLLRKRIDENDSKTSHERDFLLMSIIKQPFGYFYISINTFKQHHAMRNGQPMFLNFILLLENYIFRRS